MKKITLSAVSVLLAVAFVWQFIPHSPAAMAQKKLSELTADTLPTSDDLVQTTNDPGGTPASRKVTLSNLAKGIDLTNIPTASGAITLAPASGSGLTVTLATTGDLVVNTDDFVVDTSAARVGIGSAAPHSYLDVRGETSLSQDSYLSWKNSAGTFRGAITASSSSVLTVLTGSTPTQRMSFDDSGNFLLGLSTAAAGTSAIRVFGIQNGTAPTTSPADMVQLYAKDWNGAATGALFIRNEESTIHSFGSSVGIGTATPNVNAAMDITSTTKAFMPPRMTTTQKNAIASPTAGMIVYDSTLAAFHGYTAAWGSLGGGPTTLTGSATLNFPSTLVGSTSDLTITVTGAALSDVVSLGIPNGSVSTDGLYSAWVSASNTVTVRFSCVIGAGADPASGTFKVTVTQF